MPEPELMGLELLDPDGDFRHRLAADRQALAHLTADLWRLAPPARRRRLAEIETLAHRLAGAAGTFGYVAIGEAALALEDLLIDHRQGRPPDPATLATRLAVLEAALA